MSEWCRSGFEKFTAISSTEFWLIRSGYDFYHDFPRFHVVPWVCIHWNSGFENHSTYPSLALGLLLIFDPAASDSIHQAVAKHDICVHGSQRQSLSAKFDQIADILLVQCVMFEVLFYCFVLHIAQRVIRARSTFLNRLSPVSISNDSVSSRNSVLNTLRTCFIA